MNTSFAVEVSSHAPSFLNSAANKETCMERRLGRIVRTQAEVENFILYFNKYVWPYYELYSADIHSIPVHIFFFHECLLTLTCTLKYK